MTQVNSNTESRKGKHLTYGGLCQVVLGLVNLSIFLALYFSALTLCNLNSLLPRGLGRLLDHPFT